MTNLPIVVLGANEADSSIEQGSFGWKVWAHIAATIHRKKSKYDYRTQLDEWCNFIGAEKGTEQGARLLTNATSLHAFAYAQKLAKMPGLPSRDGDAKRSEVAAPRTVRKKLAALRAIYRDLRDEGLCSLNPIKTEYFPGVSYAKRPTEMLPVDKVWTLLDSVLNRANSELVQRDRAILGVLFGGGLRREEIVNLRVGDVRRTEKGVTWLYLRRTKSGRDAEQVIAPFAAELVWAWHARRLQFDAQPTDYLFCPVRKHAKHYAGGVGSSQVYRLMKKYLHEAGLDSKLYSPHSARATAITQLLAQGKDPRAVQEFSRHSSIGMVYLYDKRRTAKDESVGNELEFPRQTGTS